MGLLNTLQDDLKTAMRGGERMRIDVLRMTIAAIRSAQNAAVSARYDALVKAGTDEETAATEIAALDKTALLSEAEEVGVLAKESKRRRDAVDAYRKARREDLAGQEEAEAKIIDSYLPTLLTADELRPLVAALMAELGTGPTEMSKLMPRLMSEFKGRADGRVINQVAKEVLGQL